MSQYIVICMEQALYNKYSLLQKKQGHSLGKYSSFKYKHTKANLNPALVQGLSSKIWDNNSRGLKGAV